MEPQPTTEPPQPAERTQPSAESKQIAVTLSTEMVAWAEEMAEHEGRSVSDVVEDALREQRRGQAMDRLLREYGANELNDEHMAALRAEVHGT